MRVPGRRGYSYRNVNLVEPLFIECRKIHRNLATRGEGLTRPPLLATTLAGLTPREGRQPLPPVPRGPPRHPSAFTTRRSLPLLLIVCSPPSAPSLPPPRSPDPRPHPRPHLRPPPLVLSTRGPGPRQFFDPTISSLVAPNPHALVPTPPASRPSLPRSGTLGLDRTSLRLFPLAPVSSLAPCRPIALPPSPFPTERRAIRLFLSSTLFYILFSA